MPTKSTENAAAAKKATNKAIAKAANDYAAHRFGAPVTSTTVDQVDRALRAAKLNRSHFIGSGKNLASAKQIDNVVRGIDDVRSLPSKTRESLTKLTREANVQEASDGNVPKLWGKKVLIAYRAMLNQKPARKPRAAKPQPQPTEPTIEIAA